MITTQQLSAWIQRSKKILLITGDHFTGDGTCALLALQKVLKKLKKEVIAIKPKPAPAIFNFLQSTPQLKQSLESKKEIIISLPKGKNEINHLDTSINENSTEIIITPQEGKTIDPNLISVKRALSKFDLIITVNTSCLEDLDPIYQNNIELFTTTPIINISANATNEFYGKINKVDITKSSTCEILFEWIYNDETFAKYIDTELSTILLAGIISKTESFLVSNTKSNALYTAGILQKTGAHQSDIIEHLFKRKRLPVLKLWGVALENLEFDPFHKIAWTMIKKNDLKTTNTTTNDLEDLSNNLVRHLKEAEISVFFIETNSNKIEIEIRFKASNKALKQSIEALFENTEKIANGFKVLITEGPLELIKTKLLQQLIQQQKQQNPNIPSNLKLTKQELKNESQKKEAPLQTKKNQTTQKTAHIPKEIPFQIFKKHSNGN